ncbi:hypothetical protein ACFVIM_33405 [Streptomyces sp. NPDC057638]|uniref:hypothetical protein n=1 Tax=Streptomyces sp. NPDC057638 TaxID=3346190 RepID=UPI0036785BF4
MPIPAHDSPAYWLHLAETADRHTAAARRRLVTPEVLGPLLDLHRHHPHAVLDLAAVLLALTLRACPSRFRTPAGLPDMDRLFPYRADALAVLRAASGANRLFGRPPAAAADIEEAERQAVVLHRVRDSVTAAWRAGAGAVPPQQPLPALRAALAGYEDDPGATSAVLAIATAAAVHVTRPAPGAGPGGVG